MCPAIPSDFAGDLPLPEKWILESLVAEFTASDFSLVFPLINSHLFEKTVRLAYTADDAEPMLDCMTAKACVLAFASLSSYHFPASKASSKIDGDYCAKAAQALIPEIIEDASVTTLQTVLILVSCQLFPVRYKADSFKQYLFQQRRKKEKKRLLMSNLNDSYFMLLFAVASRPHLCITLLLVE